AAASGSRMRRFLFAVADVSVRGPARKRHSRARPAMHQVDPAPWHEDFNASDLPVVQARRALEVAESAPLELAIVIPTLDERDNIAPLLEGVGRALHGIAHEVIFVDDASTDGTPDLIAAIGRRDRAIRLIRRHGRRGLSSAVTEGALATTAPIVAVMDADGQHDETILPALYRAVASGNADVAVGTRYARGGS